MASIPSIFSLSKLFSLGVSELDSPVRTEITIETHEVMVIRRRGNFPKSNCAECGEQATMLTLDEATTVFGISTRKLFQFVEEGKLHFMETIKGTLLVCSESLSAIAAPQQPLLTDSSAVGLTM